MGMDIPAPFTKTIKKLAAPAIVFYLLPWLMLLLTLGTLAQKELGIYAAQHIFFSSWILWFGPLPLPGGYATLGALTFCLLVKFIFYSEWRLERAGTILTHLGVLVLLTGGLVTALTQTEGFLSIREGMTGKVISDYHQRVLKIRKDDTDLAAIPFEHLTKGKVLDVPELPFAINVEMTCANCRPAPPAKMENLRGLAQQMNLVSAPSEKENEANLAGGILTVSGLPGDQDGRYVTMEEISEKPIVTVGGARYTFFMDRATTVLPFTIEMIDFEKEMHPGTNTAKSYSSSIIVHEGGIDWPFHIRMNEPLRYKGYTFYQASFSERAEGTYSVLSVVRNQGRIFPYLASAIIFIGLSAHVLLRLGKKKRITA